MRTNEWKTSTVEVKLPSETAPTTEKEALEILEQLADMFKWNDDGCSVKGDYKAVKEKLVGLCANAETNVAENTCGVVYPLPFALFVVASRGKFIPESYETPAALGAAMNVNSPNIAPAMKAIWLNAFDSFQY